MTGRPPSRPQQRPASPRQTYRCSKPPQYRSPFRIDSNSAERSGPLSGGASSTISRRAGRARPASTSASNRDSGIAVICATGRPRSVMVTVSPDAASATTADAFCFRARIPTSDMCFVVAQWWLEILDSPWMRKPPGLGARSPTERFPWPAQRPRQDSNLRPSH